MTRRESFVAHTVVYAAVGASDAPDLLRFPPEGSTPFAEELRLGSGSDRFLLASSVLMTWGAQRVNGIDVVEITPGDGGHYSGITFDASGTPQPAADEDLQFSQDGVQYLRAGSVVELHWPGDRPSLQFRVVYTVDSPREVGFALGSADDAGVPGEVRYAVEHREDDSVWATARGFLFPTQAGLLGLKGKSEARAVIAEVRAQMTGLAPGAAVLIGDEEPDAAEAAMPDGDEAAETHEQLGSSDTVDASENDGTNESVPLAVADNEALDEAPDAPDAPPAS